MPLSNNQSASYNIIQMERIQIMDTIQKIKHKANVLFISKISGYPAEIVEEVLRNESHKASEIYDRGKTIGKLISTHRMAKLNKPKK